MIKSLVDVTNAPATIAHSTLDAMLKIALALLLRLELKHIAMI